MMKTINGFCQQDINIRSRDISYYYRCHAHSMVYRLNMDG